MRRPEGCISERKSPLTGRITYQIKYDLPSVDGNRRQKYESFPTRELAEKKLREIFYSMDKGSFVDPNAMTLREYSTLHWFPAIETGRAAKTVERYKQIFQVNILPQIGEMKLQKITALQIDGLYTTLRKTLSEQTILHVHRVLSLCLKEAAKKALIIKNPVQDATTPRPSAARLHKDPTEKVQVLTPEQLHQLITGFKGHDLFDFAVVAAGTGARRGELCGLMWSDVDFEARTLSIYRSVEETRTFGIRIKPPKNKASKRKIGIDENLIRILKDRKLRQVQDRLKLGKKLPADAFIFPKTVVEPCIPRSPDTLSQIFIRKAKKLGFNFGPHSFRHTHATLLLEAGTPVNTVAQRLGHSSPKTTLEKYGHVLKRSEDQAVSVAASLLRGI